MKSLLKSGTFAVLGAALVAATMATAADASPRSRARNAAIIGGIAAATIIAGAAVASERSYAVRRYYGGCSDLRRRATWNEERGNFDRAAYYWDRYAECRGE